jgi:hypothetical protein
MRTVFAEVKRVLRDDGVMFINCGDAYRDKQLLGLPWRLALALQADGWILRSELIWHKLNPMPESVQDRPTRAHEQVFLFSKQGRYYYDGEAVRESGSANSHGSPHINPGIKQAILGQNQSGRLGQWTHEDRLGCRAMRSVLALASEPLSMAHFATFPTALVRTCLLAGAPMMVCSACGKPWVRQVERTFIKLANRLPTRKALQPGADMADINSHEAMGYNEVRTTGFAPTCTCAASTRPGVVFDPFCGSGTTLLVARALGLDAVGTDLSWPYLATIARQRLGLTALQAWQEGEVPRQEHFYDLPLFAT